MKTRTATITLLVALGGCGHKASGPAVSEVEQLTLEAEAWSAGKVGHGLDHAKAFELAQRACARGSAHGCALLGGAYQDGMGVGWDPKEAEAAYEKACLLGSGVGCFNLGTMYSGGHGVVANQAKSDELAAKATTLWTAACQGAEPRWCTNAAFMIARDHAPTAAELEQMTKLDQRACDHGVLVGCVEVIRNQRDANTLAGPAAIAKLDPLCAKGEPTACTLSGLAHLSEVARAPNLKAVAGPGLAMLKTGCEQGDRNGCIAYGVEASEGEAMDRDDAAAEQYFGLACDRGLGEACQGLAVRWAERDHARAAAFAERGCYMGTADACAFKARMQSAEAPGAASAAEAMRFFTLACEMGSNPSCAPLVMNDVPLPVPLEQQPKLLGYLCSQGVSKACSRDIKPIDVNCNRILDEQSVTGCIGKLVTLVGVVEHAKMPTLLGVDVDAPSSLGAQVASATGKLEQYVIDDPKPGDPLVASRGPGTYLRLDDPSGSGLAVAKPQP